VNQIMLAASLMKIVEQSDHL